MKSGWSCDFRLSVGEDYTTERGGLWRCLRSAAHGALIMDEYTGRKLRITGISLEGETVDEGRERMTIIGWKKQKEAGYENYDI